jgi:hypothetical protein
MLFFCEVSVLLNQRQYNKKYVMPDLGKLMRTAMVWRTLYIMYSCPYKLHIRGR